MAKNILISGGTGLVGGALIELLQTEAYNLAVLSRSEQKGNSRTFHWDIEKKFIDQEAVEFADIIIHLAGENISSKRWTARQKRKIVASRVASSNLLFEAVRKADKKPEMVLSASAIGYYGTYTSEAVFTEEDALGNDFLAQTVGQWEAAIDQIKSLEIPVVKLRIGVVMTPKGGALKEMIKPLKMGFASFLGKGNQYIPWIALEDLARMFLFVIKQENESTVYNAVHPKAITNKELMQALAKKYNKLFLPIGVPAFVLKILFGEMASILLEGSRVSAEKIQKKGFVFSKNDIV
jgi:uncharacterized protein (TIGR01777 family)